MAGTGGWCTASWKPMKVFGLWFGSRYPIDNHDHAAEKGSAPDQLHNATQLSALDFWFSALCKVQSALSWHQPVPRHTDWPDCIPYIPYSCSCFSCFTLSINCPLLKEDLTNEAREPAAGEEAGLSQSWDDCVGWRAGWGRENMRVKVIEILFRKRLGLF